MLEYQLDGFYRRAHERHEMLLAEAERQRRAKTSQASSSQQAAGLRTPMRGSATRARRPSFSHHFRMTPRHA